MSMPTIEQIVSRYLFNQDTPPANLKDESLIRAEGAIGDPVFVDMNEFMTVGGGRFAGVERFNFVRNFLGAHDDVYAPMGGAKLPPGVYTLEDIFEAYGIAPENRKLAVSQYYSGVFDSDFAERAYVFGSGEYQINSDALFYVNEDGSREIVDICVEPVSDNFDYDGEGVLAQITNSLTEGHIDPSGIGRQVPIIFTGSVTDKQSFTSEDWYALDIKNRAVGLAETTNKAAIATSAPYFTALFAAVLGRLAINDIITFEDAEGRFVVYDGRDVNHSGVVDPYKLKNFTELVMSSGSAVIAGNGNDTLYGTNYSNDELYGGKGNDYLDGREGADRMLGGAGDDIYVVDDEGDVVIEQAGEGVDLVRSSVTHTLGENVENLRLTGEGNIDGSGNSLDNEITGNSGNNFIRGGGGEDTIYGGGGDDTILGGVEKVNLYGESGNDDLYGGDGDDYLSGGIGNDYISGGDGHDIMDGGEGRDTLLGGAGYDTYFADMHDVIEDDPEGRGQVFLGKQRLTGGTRKESDPENTYRDNRGNVYVLSGSTLTVNGGLTILNYDKDKSTLRIVLSDEEEEDETPDTGPAENRTSPIVIDLDGDGIETLDIGASYFDLDGDGLSEMTGWVSPDDGLLVHDRNGDGRISNGTELFGNHSILSNGQTAENGFQALAEYDNNGDGVIDAQDASQCHQPKLQPCPRQAPRSSQPPWPSGDDQASAAQSGGLAGLAVM